MGTDQHRILFWAQFVPASWRITGSDKAEAGHRQSSTWPGRAPGGDTGDKALVSRDPSALSGFPSAMADKARQTRQGFGRRPRRSRRDVTWAGVTTAPTCLPAGGVRHRCPGGGSSCGSDSGVNEARGIVVLGRFPGYPDNIYSSSSAPRAARAPKTTPSRTRGSPASPLRGSQATC